MAKQAEIPCASCRSWAKKQKKFCCNPDECKGLTEWILSNAPELGGGNIKKLVMLPVSAMQYIV